MAIRELMAEPGHLALGVAPASPAGAAAMAAARSHVAGQMARRARHAERLHGRQAGIEVRARSAADLVQRAASDHGGEPASQAA